ncbi:MAG: hypothetical protein AUJ18_06635 [Candidatus Hydrogenedentes bacterium CG1_02_42_14]|nr:MAG: hypothetical protein AUJ18_06635 [Candidatus Hydrogenedentes bacterium CG1_02_42_14]
MLSSIRGNTLIRILLVLFSLFIFAGLFIIAGYFFIGVSAPELTVPELTGLDIAEALKELDNIGLVGETSAIISTDTTPIGKVVSLSPPPGTLVKKGRHIILYVSSQSPSISVPNLIETKLVEAENILKRAGAEIGIGELMLGEIVSVESDSPAGMILEQSPAPGTLLASGSRVNVVVAVDKKGNFMPNLEGMRLDLAIDTMSARGYSVEREPYFTTAWPEKTVQSQKPAPGTRLSPNIAIKLIYAVPPSPNAYSSEDFSLKNTSETYPVEKTEAEKKNNEEADEVQ